MANAIAGRVKKPTVAMLTDEISTLIDTINKNARLARESEKELVKLRKRNDKSFAQMKKALDRLGA